MNSATVESAIEEREYLTGDAHETWLRQVFDLANIEWGRIDYGVWQGKPQAWEINMNPTIGRRLHKKPKASDTAEVLAIKEEGRQHAHQNLRDAFVALEQPESQTNEVHVSLPRMLLEEVQREWRHELRRERNLAFMRRVFQSEVIGWPARLVYRTLAPRR